MQTQDCNNRNSKSQMRELINAYNVNGRPHGYWEHLWPSTGKMLSRGNYANGIKDGYWEYYYDSGAICSKGTFVNGREEGRWEWYSETGRLVSVATYKGNQ
jgi:antitoxin component YwqK of YwqJK toxin-antitoxin module